MKLPSVVVLILIAGYGTRDQQSNYTSLLQIVELFAYELPEKVEQNKEEIVKAIERLALPDAHYSLLGDLSKRLDNLAKDGMVKSILRSLGYAQMSARQSHIPEAHQKTFEWAFESPEIHFLDWLESTTGGDMFWISGKAGSGKSTLMKFLYEHQRTKSALKASAGPDKQLVIARHFFWSAGSETQKSQEGLLRSLLHDIFRQCPSLIPLVCSTQIQDDMNLGNPQPWSLKQLRKSFLKFLQLDSESSIPSIVASTRFCLFVDGLDEYDGNLADLIDLFQWKSRTPFIKICLSSRPRDVFDKAFHGKDHQKLKLQDLTKGDIQRYISDNLIDNKSGWDFNKLDQRFLDLINQITAKAEGVFLWVFLVVRSLLEGLENEDSISILEERVKEIPADLESYFQRVLDGIAKIYRRDTAHLLRIMLYRNEPLPLISLHVAMEHGNCDIEAQQGSSTDEWAIRMNDSLKKRVYARCRDLVDIDLDSKKTFTASQGL